MSDEHAPTAGSGSSFAIAAVLSCYLIGTFFWNVFVPAHEYAIRTEQMLTIGLNLLAVAGLFGLRPRMPQPLFWAAMLAAVGLLALRLTSDHAWWTGHLFYELPPR